MKLTVSDFIKNQWTAVPPVAQADLTGKTVIITGANNGIGFEAAKHFARMKPGKLILACRSKERGQTALDGE
jgi:retinol dehydrogenase-12